MAGYMKWEGIAFRSNRYSLGAGMVFFFFDQLSVGNVVGNMLAILAGSLLAFMFVMIGRGGDDDSTRIIGYVGSVIKF